MRIIVYWGLYWGPLIVGNYHMKGVPALGYRIRRGSGSRGESTREPWGTLGKLREYKGITGTTRLPTPLDHPLFKDIQIRGTI